MPAEVPLRRNPQPSFDEICWEMTGNLCHCRAYVHIFNTVAEAAKARDA